MTDDFKIIKSATVNHSAGAKSANGITRIKWPPMINVYVSSRESWLGIYYWFQRAQELFRWFAGHTAKAALRHYQ
jgi:hypothetical protein